ncbi:uncharacterized protein LOC108675084 [Hyalella azteca]|uniref:Uncharacterized protein LOC108675084 n=1 Tax=Hyalella azteca TaxID=294128 RepID=A0A8B7NXY0_HYAAZ|nr:uncharacterized protein LOC108675084 [Hyalella azteca]
MSKLKAPNKSEEEERELLKLELTRDGARERAEQEIEREKRAHERELRALELEKLKLQDERQAREAQLELARLQANSSPINSSGSRSVIKLAGYKDGEDVSIYLNTFEKVKEANQWSDTIAVTALLNGFANTKVSLFLSTLPLESTYAEIKHQIVKTFGYTIYDYQSRFRNAKQKSGSFRQFVLYLRENFSKMCQIAEVNNDVKKMEELLLKDQILRAAERPLTEYLKERDIFRRDLDSVIEMADNFQAIHRPPKPASSDVNARMSFVCLRCNKPGHIAKFCRSKSGGSPNDVPSIQSATHGAASNDNDINEKKCFNCRSIGHFSRFCPEKRKSKPDEKSGDVRLSRKDDTFNVNASLSNPDYNSYLPTSNGTCNGKSVKVLRDTGATAVLVRPSLAPESSISSKTVKLTFADDLSVNAPKTMVDLRCPHFTGRVEALCLPELPFDVLLGNIPGATCACGAKTTLRATTEEVVGEQACAVQARAQRKEENSPTKLQMPTKIVYSPQAF